MNARIIRVFPALFFVGCCAKPAAVPQPAISSACAPTVAEKVQKETISEAALIADLSRLYLGFKMYGDGGSYENEVNTLSVASSFEASDDGKFELDAQVVVPLVTVSKDKVGVDNLSLSWKKNRILDAESLDKIRIFTAHPGASRNPILALLSGQKPFFSECGDALLYEVRRPKPGPGATIHYVATCGTLEIDIGRRLNDNLLNGISWKMLTAKSEPKDPRYRGLCWHEYCNGISRYRFTVLFYE